MSQYRARSSASLSVYTADRDGRRDEKTAKLPPLFCCRSRRKKRWTSVAIYFQRGVWVVTVHGWRKGESAGDRMPNGRGAEVVLVT